jgi:hypothetical protein
MGRAPIKTSVALQQKRGPNGLCLDQIIVPKVAEIVRQSFWRTILPPSVDSYQRGVWAIPISDLFREGCSTPLNRLKEAISNQSNRSLGYHTCCGPWTNTDGFGAGVSNRGTMGANISLSACEVPAVKLWWQDIMLGVVRRSKASLMGISRRRRFPLNLS